MYVQQYYYYYYYYFYYCVMAQQNHKQKYKAEDMGSIIRKRRLWWLGHVWCMDKDRRANQVLHWVPEGKKRRARPRKNWTETVKNDLRGLEISWERVKELAMEKMRCPMCRNAQETKV